MPEVSGIILAGGQSRRLGTNKAFVKVGGIALIERVAERVRHLASEVAIVTNDPASYGSLGARVVPDTWPRMGSLGGIYSGLEAACYERALVVGCDMPFLDHQLLRFMILLSADYDVVLPNVNGLLEPLHAIYNKACLPAIERLLRAGDLRIIDFLGEVRVRYVDEAELRIFDPQQLSFFNVNTPEDLERAHELAARGCCQC